LVSAVHEVLAVRYGTLPSLKSHLFYRYEAYREPDVEQSLDYFFWVLRGGERTLVIDTGFDPAVGRRRGRTCLCSPREALSRLGIDPRSVGQVIITHFHYDHIGNLDAFPDAELLVPERELRFWTGPSARRSQFAEHVEPDEIARVAEAHRQGRVRTLAGQASVAPGVTAVTVGGHSPGQLVLLVEGTRGQAVLASDAVHLYEEFERDRPFAIIADLEEMYRAYDLVRRLCEESGAVLVPGHDPAVMSRFPAQDGEAEGIAVRVA
jgi:glyoxylase-like metal-dependent hydrolase (beta-lactamase superfamily II)